MLDVQRHRGPDDIGIHLSPTGLCGLGQRRLSIIDLSKSGHQPMPSADGNLWITFNGEIYNYLELREELKDYPFRTRTDTEVILAAYEKWGDGCLDRLRGMFAFLIWNEHSRTLFAARDRFGVKPLYYSQLNESLFIASEIKALHAGGVPPEPDDAAWAAYLALGYHDHSDATFWGNVQSLAPGHMLRWQRGRGISVSRWYDIADHVDQESPDPTAADARRRYRELLTDSVRLRFRADVPVGINLSGGLDSSVLLALVHEVQGKDSPAHAYTFATHDERYDELPWVKRMLAQTKHPHSVCSITPNDVPTLSESIQQIEDEPFGGLPTLAYARLFEIAREQGTLVLLDGQGMDEQLAGYDYYTSSRAASLTVQGSSDRPVRPECLLPEFRALARTLEFPCPFRDSVRNMQYRDIRYTKIPRVLRFNDRASMRSSVELREPFLDHKLVEFAFQMPNELKIQGGHHKWLLREIAADLVPRTVAEAPKRPVQTPQREWLRGPLKKWATEQIELAIEKAGGSWLEPRAIRSSWKAYCTGEGDNSFYVWQWISLGMLVSKFKGITQSV